MFCSSVCPVIHNRATGEKADEIHDHFHMFVLWFHLTVNSAPHFALLFWCNEEWSINWARCSEMHVVYITYLHGHRKWKKCGDYKHVDAREQWRFQTKLLSVVTSPTHFYFMQHVITFLLLLFCCSSWCINKIQTVQNAAATVCPRTQTHYHITPILSEPYWLPVKYCIDYKMTNISALKHWMVWHSTTLMNFFLMISQTSSIKRCRLFISI